MPISHNELSEQTVFCSSELGAVFHYLFLVNECCDLTIIIGRDILAANPKCGDQHGKVDAKEYNPADVTLKELIEKFQVIKVRAAVVRSKLREAGSLTQANFKQFYEVVLEHIHWSGNAFLAATAIAFLHGEEKKPVLNLINQLKGVRESRQTILKSTIDGLCKKFKVGLYKAGDEATVHDNDQRFSYSVQNQSSDQAAVSGSSTVDGQGAKKDKPEPFGGCCSIQ